MQLRGAAGTIVLAASLAGFAYFWNVKTTDTPPVFPPVESVRILPGRVDAYRAPGAFDREGRITDAPAAPAQVTKTLDVLTYQVTRAQYARCVAEGICNPPAGPDGPKGQDTPVTGVSYLDANLYAWWFSRLTGQRWRLPRDLEWVHMAEAGIETGTQKTDNPDPSNESASWSDLWLNRYRQESRRAAEEIRQIRPSGFFGRNAAGIADIGGNVWEWTENCFERVSMDSQGRITSRMDFCGVRVLQGRHRAYLPDFTRDALAGGCAAGTPPDYIGFRLVREVPWHERAVSPLFNVLRDILGTGGQMFSHPQSEYHSRGL